MPTAVASPERPASPSGPPSPIGRLDASDSAISAAFAPGQVIASRYRIVGLLGRGGMGEVYRADDLRLGQPVSLKFLPRRLAESPGMLERFHAEVRNARQVSHPNVCRVYDIGEVDGQQFLTMEFVDGEDLATLLRRIGHLPTAKAHEVARQLCAGIAAAHDKGVLHRDLKPSNVMIDGNGRVRITDFGLAIRADQANEGDIAGTPAYMAPEQFEGRTVTERSDLYSLGLILYEIYTGQRPFEATSIAEWKLRHARSEPSRPSQHGTPLDEATERAILRCLEKDPSRRPRSALELAAALPGGDPIAAALAAGETPSPEMVAASGGEGALSPRAASLMLAVAIAMIAAVLILAPYSTDLGLAPMKRNAGALRERARQVLARFGLEEHSIDSADWFERDYDRLQYASRHEVSTRWRKEQASRGAPVQYVYRQSPDWMSLQDWEGRVNWIQPPPILPEMGTVQLNAEGALRSLLWNPPAFDSTDVASVAAPDWSALFSEAQLDISHFHAVHSRWVPSRPFDVRADWAGPAPWDPKIELTVSAAAYRGRPVSFIVHGPWERPMTSFRPTWSASRWVVVNTTFVLLAGLLATSVYLAIRNVRLGRGDRRGALRLGGFSFVCVFVGWLTRTHFVPDLAPMIWNLFGQGLGPALVIGLFSASLYLALEPYVRRRMPTILIGWARLLEGRFRDARVGREVLIGAVGGASVAALLHLTSALPRWIPIAGETTAPPDVDLLYGGIRSISTVMRMLESAVTASLAIAGVLFVLRLLLRNGTAATIGTMFVAIVLSLGGENFLLETPGAVIAGVIIVTILVREGLLGVVAMAAVQSAITVLPLPLGGGAPYTATSLTILAILTVLFWFVFRSSLGSKVRIGRGIAAELG